jgi:hypothetical protein
MTIFGHRDAGSAGGFASPAIARSGVTFLTMQDAAMFESRFGLKYRERLQGIACG